MESGDKRGVERHERLHQLAWVPAHGEEVLLEEVAENGDAVGLEEVWRRRRRRGGGEG
jgi:hypothetical protein